MSADETAPTPKFEMDEAVSIIAGGQASLVVKDRQFQGGMWVYFCESIGVRKPRRLPFPEQMLCKPDPPPTGVGIIGGKKFE